MVNSLGGISNINNSSNNNSMSMGKKRVSKRHKVKPLKPRGRLIENSEMIGPKCLARDIKAIGKGIKGEANDYELGRQNDLAMAVGSYGLAGYLATKTPTTKGKIMEFVGASVFLGMMKLWPKIAFQYPLQARYGVNVCQKYEDSYGRIKDFYQDPQYTPWDLYSQEDYDMMAKKMGIPDNAKNKNQKVQETAHDIALQANTWWMLTAGLASGIGTPLLCNQLEKPVAALAQWIDLNAAKLQLDRIKVVEVTKDYKPQNTKALKDLEAVLSENKTLTSEVVDKLTKILTLVGKDEKADITCVYAMKQQIQALAPTTTFDAERVLGYFKNPQGCSNFNGLNLKDLIKKYNIDLSKIDISKIKSSDEFLEQLDKAASNKKILGHTIDDAFRPILQELNSMFNPSTIDGDFKKNITDLFNRMDAVRTNQKHMFNFYKKNVGDVEGSIIANYANKFNDAFVKALGIKGKDLKAASQNDKAAREVVTKYLQEACKDEKKYTKVIKKLAKIQEDLLKTLDEDLLKKYADKVKDGTDVFGEGDTFSIIKRHFVGSGEQFLDGSQLKVYQSQLARRIEGIQAFFAKPIVALDIFRRIETGDLEKQWKAFQSSDTSLKNVKFEDVKKIITEMFTKNDKTSSYATKHGISTPSLYQAIYKLVYPLEVPVGETLEDIALNGKHSNKNYYKGFLSKDTIAALGEENSKILQILSDISAKINFWLGYGSDPLNPNCKPNSDVYYAPKLNANIFAKDDLVSQSMERVVSDTAKRKRNTKIWSGFMIGTAVITVATTLIALLTIGKGSKKEQKKTQNSSKGVVA